MLTCAILGDSIAVGVSNARPDCTSVARVGIGSAAYLRSMLRPLDAQTVVISLGVNDGPHQHTFDNLRALRTSLHATQVYWLLPGVRDYAREAIRSVARQFGDHVIDTQPLVGRDHLHPSGSGYRLLARLTLTPGVLQQVALTEAKPGRAIIPDGHRPAHRDIASP